MNHPKRTCIKCKKTKRAVYTETYDEYGMCVSCFDKSGKTRWPTFLPETTISIEVNPVDLYWNEAVMQYAARGYKGLL